MNTAAAIQTLINNGINFIFAPQDSIANMGLDRLMKDSTYHAETREQAESEIAARNEGSGYKGDTWIWDLREELANA